MATLMPSTPDEHLTIGEIADNAADAIRQLNHSTRPATGGLAEPSDTDQIIAALASMTGMLPQLLSQLAHWLDHQHHQGQLRVDDPTLLDTTQTVHALIDRLREATRCLQSTTAELDAAHQHAAHLAANNRSQNSCRSVGPSHLTKRTHRSDSSNTSRWANRLWR